MAARLSIASLNKTFFAGGTFWAQRYLRMARSISRAVTASLRKWAPPGKVLQSSLSCSNTHIDHHLALTGSTYSVPKGDWFNLVPCAHYLAEIVLYIGLLVACDFDRTAVRRTRCAALAVCSHSHSLSVCSSASSSRISQSAHSRRASGTGSMSRAILATALRCCPGQQPSERG